MSGVYLELLGDGDLALLAQAAGLGGEPAELAAGLRASPERIDALLGERRVYDAFFQTEEADRLLFMSPFLAFSILVARAAQELAGRRFVEEWAGPGRRVPVFDVSALRDFVGVPRRRVFVAELLTSYTHVASGSVLVRTRRGWRRHRFSELDPVRLAELLEVLPEQERAAVYRRLGDLALFLSGVFPDHAGSRPLAPRHVERLGRLLGERGALPAAQSMAALGGTGSGAIAVLEWLGRRSYRLADEASRGSLDVFPLLGDVAERFSDARRTLNFVTDRYLFPLRRRWFGVGAD